MNKFFDIIRSKTVAHAGITTSSTVLTGILGLLFYTIAARTLGPSSFGIFSVSIATLTLIADISDLGTDTGIVRFLGKFIKSDKDKALRILKLGMEIKVLISIVVILAGWFAIPFIAENILAKPELTIPLRLSLFGVLAAQLFSFSSHALQGVQKFWTWGIMNVGANVIRLLLIGLLFYLSRLSTMTVLAVYITSPLLGFMFGILFLPGFWKVKDEKREIKEFLGYNKWVAGFTAISAVSSRLDTYFSTRLLNLSDVGIYSVSVQLSSIIPQIVFALAASVAPKLASFDTHEKAKVYIKKLQLFTLGLGTLGLLIGIPAAKFIIPVFYGPAYVQSVTYFIILMVSQVIFFISIPAHTAVIYYFSYPKLFVYISLGHLLITSTFGWYLISNFGVMGAAITVLIGSTFNFIIPFVWVVRRFKNKR